MRSFAIGLCIFMLSLTSFAAENRKTVEVSYEYDIVWEKLKGAEVICIEIYDGREDGEGDLTNEYFWFKNFSQAQKAKSFEEKGLYLTRLPDGIHCNSTGTGQVPVLTFYEYGAYAKKADIEKAIVDGNVKFYKTDLVYYKIDKDAEVIGEIKGTAKDDAFSEIFD
jgi:hypothetical protein